MKSSIKTTPPISTQINRRDLLRASALVVTFASTTARAQQRGLPEIKPGKTLKTDEVDGFLALAPDGSVTVYCGKVDLGTGLRIAIPQMAAEELGVSLSQITLIEGDTALTPDQGPTAGSSGIMRGGVQIRQAAATAREALIQRAAQQWGKAASELSVKDGHVLSSSGERMSFASLLDGKPFALKIDEKARLKNPSAYTLVGKPLPRPDIAAKVTGQHPYMHDVKIDKMLHARVIRPAAVGAELQSVDEASIRHLDGVKIVRIKNFLAVVSAHEWTAIRAAKDLKATWSDPKTLVGHDRVKAWMQAVAEKSGTEQLTKRGDSAKTLAASKQVLSAQYYWPLQSHASMGPSCGIADVRADGATIWSASQATHRLRGICARILELPADKVRVIYRDGAGCYGTNGHDDVCADAALISKAVGQPVRVQWSREDELGWDPKGPPQYLSLRGSTSPEGKLAAWETEMWLPKATASLPNIVLLGPESAGIAQPQGISTGLISQNAHPPYAHPDLTVSVNWLKDSPLRPSNIRAPGKIANSFAVESFVDELAAQAQRDPLEFRLEGLSDPRGLAVCKKVAELMNWQSRPSPMKSGNQGRGFSYVHYKFNETYVAIGMEVAIERRSGRIKVKHIVCAHDCGLIINPDATRQQVEGNILQTLSRTLFEETQFDRSKVTSTDWSSYPLMTFPDVPELVIALIDRPDQPPLGAGEAACAAVPAALANAVYDACGARLRNVPFTSGRVKLALARGYA